MEIRLEKAEDANEISQLTTAAFKNVEHSSQTEAAIIDALRKAHALTISAVAVEDSEIVGHAAISPVLINGCNVGWFGLGPVSVRPDRQEKGIGSAIIRYVLEKLSQSGSNGCVVLGEPTYYRRFGFEVDTRLYLGGVPPEFFMCLCMTGEMPVGEVTYHAAFKAE